MRISKLRTLNQYFIKKLNFDILKNVFSLQYGDQERSKETWNNERQHIFSQYWNKLEKATVPMNGVQNDLDGELFGFCKLISVSTK